MGSRYQNRRMHWITIAETEIMAPAENPKHQSLNKKLIFVAYLLCSRAWWRRALDLTEWSKDLPWYASSCERTPTGRRGRPQRKRPTKQYRYFSAGFQTEGFLKIKYIADSPRKTFGFSEVSSFSILRFRTTSHNRRVVLRSDLRRSCQRDAHRSGRRRGGRLYQPIPSSKSVRHPLLSNHEQQEKNRSKPYVSRAGTTGCWVEGGVEGFWGCIIAQAVTTFFRWLMLRTLALFVYIVIEV